MQPSPVGGRGSALFHAVRQTLASSATLQISRWALAHGSSAKPTRSVRGGLPFSGLWADSPRGESDVRPNYARLNAGMSEL